MPSPSEILSNPPISEFLRSRISAGDFPSAVYLVAERGEPLFADALGDAVVMPDQHAATLETIYDLASLTKPLVTGLLCATRVQSHELKLDDRIADHLHEFDRADKRHITIRQLLTHTSGLPAWRPLYFLAQTKEQVLDAIANEPLEYRSGERVVYSDLGFIVLGLLLQRLTNAPLAELGQREIFERLKLEHSFFNPTHALQTGIAACESGNNYERDMCERDFAAASYKDWRNDAIWGEVHDGNAHFLGGAAGHAGLFASVGDTLRLGNQFVAAQSELLSPETCQLFHQNMTPGLNEARSFGWQLAETKDSTAGPALPANAFGHTGFTGTSCWIDAAPRRVFILLTNRTHNRSLPFANINQVRRDFHSLAVAALNDRR